MEIVKGKYYKYNDAFSFTLKALANSTHDTFNGVVVLGHPNIQWEVGEQSDDWSSRLFVESDLSEFLVEANKRYPLGSQYESASISNSRNQLGKGQVEVVSFEARLFYYHGSTNIVGVEMGNGLVYNFHDDEWAVPCDTSEPIECHEAAPFSEEETRVNVFEENDLFNMDTNEGRLAYAKKHYPIGTEFLNNKGQYRKIIGIPRFICDNKIIEVESIDSRGDTQYPDIYGEEYGWCEIIKKGEEMGEIKKLTRQGLKEIHSVACGRWQATLEAYGARNPLEDYIELSQKEVEDIFKACSNKQLLIVSKHLKQTSVKHLIKGIDDDELRRITNRLLKVRLGGEYEYASFTLNESFDWEIKEDDFGYKCLVPTIKK